MTDNPIKNLTTGAQRIVEAALQKKETAKHEQLGVNHWLLALLDNYGPMLESMVTGFDSTKSDLDLRKKIARGDVGSLLDEMTVIRKAEEYARQRAKLQPSEKDIAAVVLMAAGFTLNTATGLGKIGKAVPIQAGSLSVAGMSATPTLDKFGKDLTAAARENKLPRLVGREEETQLIIETLCRRTKRNPVLVGPAGVGKTAVVEGLAQKVVLGLVPGMLKNNRIIALQSSILVAGTRMSGDLENRMQSIIQEASQEGIILFIDEIHSIMGAGGMPGTSDIASILKPALARGDLACIAATTNEEYRRFIETDTALERRFQPIRVNEMSAEQTLSILSVLREDLAKKYQITTGDETLKWLVQFAQHNLRNRFFPDKGVDLLEQAFAHAVAQGKTNLDMADAQEVAQRMIGMPLALEVRIDNLKKALQDHGVFSQDEINALINRLQVTMKGLDIRPGRPNAVLLLSGGLPAVAAGSSDAISQIIAKNLFGASERVITIDLSRLYHPEDINLLVGSPPGYVGYSDSLPLHRLTQTPWCVVRFENVDQCHPQIREIIAQAFMEGWLMDGRGKPIYFSDTVMILTADIKLLTHRNLGFHTTPEEVIENEDLYKAVSTCLGLSLAEQVDIIVMGVPGSVGLSESWIESSLLKNLSQQYLNRGLIIKWDKSLVDWLSIQHGNYRSEREWERWIDQHLIPEITRYLPKPADIVPVDITMSVENEQLVVRTG